MFNFIYIDKDESNFKIDVKFHIFAISFGVWSELKA